MEESIKTPDRPEDGRDGSLGMNAGDRCGQAWEEAGKNTGRGSLLAAIKDVFPGKQQDIRSYSPLTLAYIGDVVYDLIIRTVVVSRANRPVNDLHRITVRYVSAGAQSRIVQTLMDSFTEEEQ